DRDWLFARRSGLVAQQTRHPRFGVPSLPTPHCRTAHTGTAGHLQHRQAFGREQNNAGALHMLHRPGSITNDRFQADAILVADDDTKLLGHTPRIPYPDADDSSVSVSALVTAIGALPTRVLGSRPAGFRPNLTVSTASPQSLLQG